MEGGPAGEETGVLCSRRNAFCAGRAMGRLKVGEEKEVRRAGMERVEIELPDNQNVKKNKELCVR